MRIRVTSHDGRPVFPFDTAGPWKYFKQELESGNHSISTEGFESKVDAIVVNKVNRTILRYMDEMSIPLNRRVLIIWEPYVVDQENYLQENLSKFGHIFAPSISWSKRVNGNFFNWPQDKIMPSDEPLELWNLRKNKAIIIQGNKFSAVKGEQYSLRRSIIQNTTNEELDLYGRGWNRGFAPDWYHWSSSIATSKIGEISLRSAYNLGKKYAKYKGEVTGKIETLKNYKFSIVVENSSDYVSEKLFDSINAGCVTIYVGANLNDYGMGPSTAFQVAAEADAVILQLRKLIGMNSDELYNLSIMSRNSLTLISDNWENTFVLADLARKIRAKIK